MSSRWPPRNLLFDFFVKDSRSLNPMQGHSFSLFVSLFLFQTLLFLPGCASSKPSKKEEVRASEIELQEELQRFTTQFLERMSQATIQIYDSNDPRVRSLAAHQSLRYASSALDIATGPRPELNLLDMMTFIRLSRGTVKDYWIPKFYGAKGKDLLTAFDDAERDISVIANGRMTTEQMATVDRLLQNWRNENPDLILVEGVRLTDFAHHAGKLESERSEEIGGLISGIKGAVSTADQAFLLANRAIFLGQRMPSLLRLQTRIGAQEILSDTMKQLSTTGDFATESSALAQELSAVLMQLNEALRQAGPLMKEYRQHFPYNPNSTLDQKLTTANMTVVEMRKLLEDLNNLSPEAVQKGVQEVRQQIKEMIWELTKAIAILGVILIGFWWLGYYLVVRRGLLSRKTD